MSDYNFLMESRLSPEQYRVLVHISRIAVDEGLNIYLAGGAVRDLTYGLQMAHDLDFAVEGNPEKIARALVAGRPPTVSPLGPRPAEAGSIPAVAHFEFDRRLNSAEIQFANGVRAEIAMSRTERYPRPGKRPEIAPSLIFDDLRRRDFSVNAMAVSLHPNSRGLLLDPTNGAADIEKHELRVLHNRSFSDDPVRIYRLFRLGLRLGFKPDEKTQNLLEKAIEDRAWTRLEPDRQGRELNAILREDDPGKALKMLSERGLLSGLDRKLARARIPYDRFARIRAIAPSVPGSDTFLVNLHNAVAKLSRGQRSRLGRKVIANRKLLASVLSFERDARKLGRALSSSRNALPSRVVKLLTGRSPTLLLFMRVHSPKPKVQGRIRDFLHKYPLVRARLPRAELLAMGAKPGPKFEKIMEQLFLDQIDGKVKTPQQLAKHFRKLAGIPEPPPPKAPKREKAPKAAKPAKHAEFFKGARPARPTKKAKTARAPKRIRAVRRTAKKPKR